MGVDKVENPPQWDSRPLTSTLTLSYLLCIVEFLRPDSPESNFFVKNKNKNKTPETMNQMVSQGLPSSVFEDFIARS